jgi:signal transduction histidine kinase
MPLHEGYSPRNRAERVIAAGRLFLAVFLSGAILLDPTEPRPQAPLVLQLAIGYVVYAAGFGLLVWQRRTTTAALSFVTHVMDLVLFSAFMHFTDSISSPFFVYFIFATLTGALRWHGTGALLTGAALLAVYVVIALGDFAFLRPGEFEVNRFVARCTQLVIVTGLVAYLAAYHHRLQREIASLAAWPRRLPIAEPDAVQEVLAYAAGVLRAPRLVLVWEAGDEPALHIAVRTAGGVELTREPPGAFGTLVASALQRCSFLCVRARATSPQVLRRIPGGFGVWRGAPLDPAFVDRFKVDSVVAMRLSAGGLDGWIFALDRRRISADDLLLGDIVGRLVAGALELNMVLEQLRDAAAGEERLRLARELHDGVLQSLTAASLQAQRARQIVATDPAEAVRRIARLEETILGEQQALRLAISDLKPGALLSAARVDCGERVREAAARVARQWEVRVHVDVQPELTSVAHGVAHEIVRMVQEALVNAVRHGRAREVSLALSESAGELRLTVAYEGRGFSGFTGRHDLESLSAMNAGPRTLKERVASLGGSMVIDSRQKGARVEIAVPVAYPGTVNAVGS